jgi:hypothetical protein
MSDGAHRAAGVVALAFAAGCWPPLEEIEGGSVDAGDAADRGSTADARVAYRDLVLADGPLVYWRFGEKSGKRIEDATGHGNTGTYYDAMLGAPGAIAFDPDTAMAVSGTTGSTAVGDSTAPDPIGVSPFTIELWFAPASQVTGGQMLVAKQINDANGDEAIGLGFDPNQGGLFFDRFVSNGRLAVTLTSMPPVGKFTYVAAVYDGTQMALYVDGSPAGQTPDARPMPPKAGGWRVGMSYADHGIFQGTIDEFALYGAALSPGQIKSHHDAGVGR